jgi:hypothetical protein
MRTFVVECYWPGMIEEQARETLERVIRIAREGGPADGAGPLGCLLLPSDGMALYVFVAPNEAAVRQIGSRAEVPFDRIIESIHIGLAGPPT